MKAELTLPQELVDLITDKIIEKLKPLLLSMSNGRAEDIVFDKKSLAEYLRVSESTISKLVSNKQIPFFKIQQGQSSGVRFYRRDITKWIQRQTIPDLCKR